MQQNTRSGKVLVVGSSNTDMVIKSKKLPGPGETVTGGTFLLAPGGKGANQAVAAARQGAEVVFAAKVGDDAFGQQAIDGYRNEKINTDLIVKEKGQATGIALILVDQKGENLISVAAGANFSWSAADVEQVETVFDSVAVVVMQLEIPLEIVSVVAKKAAQRKIPVLLDPAPAAPLSKELLGNVSILKPNQHEAGILSGIEIHDEASAVSAAEKLLELGVRDAVVITLGKEGALVLERGKSPQKFSAPIVEAVDSTAAGDAFTGALAARIAEGDDLPAAVRYANVVAALSATKLGAQPSLPTREEVRNFN